MLSCRNLGFLIIQSQRYLDCIAIIFGVESIIFKRSQYTRIHHRYSIDTLHQGMTNRHITDAKLGGLFSSYAHNGVAMSSSPAVMGLHDLSFDNSSIPSVNVALSGGEGAYAVVVVVDGVMQHIATCGPDVSGLRLTAWALQNGWALQENKIVKIKIG